MGLGSGEKTRQEGRLTDSLGQLRARLAQRSLESIAYRALYDDDVAVFRRIIERKSSRFPVLAMTPHVGHRCAITRRCNDGKSSRFPTVSAGCEAGGTGISSSGGRGGG